MTTETRNEAADYLRLGMPKPLHAKLGEALAEERRATVERMPHSRMGPPSPVMSDAFVAVRLGPKMTLADVQDGINAVGGLLYLDGRRLFPDEVAILDEEAAR